MKDASALPGGSTAATAERFAERAAELRRSPQGLGPPGVAAWRRLSQKRKCPDDRDTAQARAAKLTAESKGARGGKRAPQQAKPPARSRATPQAKSSRCTCGKPIHSEKCPLFAPSIRLAARHCLDPRPRHLKGRRPTAAREPPRRQAPRPPGPAPSLSGWARTQVLDIFAEVETLPRSAQKAALKQKLRLFHPDKRQLHADRHAKTTDAELSEVFVELKRRYDWLLRQEQLYIVFVRRRTAAL